MTEANPHDELRNLLTNLQEATSTPEEILRIEEILRDDAEARRFYIQYMDLYASMFWESSGCSPHVPSFDSLRAEADKTPKSPVLNFLGNTFNQIGDFISKPTPLSLAMAFIIMVSLLTTMALMSTDKNSGQLAKDHSSTPKVQGQYVAKITDLHNCRWEGSYIKRLYGENLTLGEVIQLKEGLMQITFRSGASAILQGPIHFRLDSKNSAFMQFGKSTFYVPKAASGFTVETTSARIVDIGTEFGVIVEESGDTETHVLKGTVKAQSISNLNKQNPWDVITENQSRKYRVNSPESIEVVYKENQFQQRIKNSSLVYPFDENHAANLLVDFNEKGKHVSPIQAGYSSVFRNAQKGRIIATDLGENRTITLTLSDLGARKGGDAKRDRDRGPIISGPGVIKSNLLRDFVHAAYISHLDISLYGLKPGEYLFTGYFHDSKTLRKPVKVSVSVDGGKTFVDAATVTYSTTDSPKEIGLGNFKFTTDGLSDIVIRINNGPKGPHIINGFELRPIRNTKPNVEQSK